LVGQTISHYRILEKLGEGGMGVVYKAEDLRLDRIVALKFLASHLVANEDVRRRFVREAKTAAALQHPNICTVHEIDEVDGKTFISMAYLEGRELADEIAEGPIETQRAIGLITQFAEGLAEAHAKGIVHRDIKPANLFVTPNGRAVILDFGLAQLATANSKLTREGTTLGTCVYMSPEQTSGADVDARTDVWALGCVLYEMLAGEAAFRGHYDQAIVYSIINEEPEPLENVPPEIDAIVRHCLAKHADDRYPDGKALLEDLQGRKASTGVPSGSSIATSSEVPRVAVLRLKTRAGDAEMESFAEGLTEDITSGLAQFRHLVVVSASAAADFQGQADAREISRGLGARFVIEGSIRKAGSSIRVSVQLLDAETGAHLWSDHFDRSFGTSDIFEAQDELTDRIVATVADPFGVLTRSLAAQVKARATDAPTAHEAVLLTFAYWQQVRPDEQAGVRAALEQALEREPDHAEALACLARLHVDEHRFNFNPPRDALDSALRTAQRAVELDATSQLAYRSLAEAHYYRFELSAFRLAADRALALNPRDTANVHWMGMLIAYSGDWETGHSIAEKVRQLNPHHPSWFYMFYLSYHYQAREYEQALAAAEKVNMPGYYFVSLDLAMINAQLGRTDEARKHLKTFIELAPDVARDPRVEISKWWGFSEESIEHKLDGLRKAGLEISGDPEPPAAASSEVPRVAVLPLKTRAGDAEMESFAEGLTEEITSGLSQFRHLVVVSASAAARFTGPADLGDVGRQLNARFLLEGSSRKTGSNVRVSVQLVDATTGAHLWAQRFDRDFGSADTLAVQDELTDRIVATVADPFGVLTRSLITHVKAKPIDILTAHECVLLMYGYLQQVRPDLHAETRGALEAALEREPNHAEAQACLALLYLEEFYGRYNPQPNPLDRGLRAAQRAVELDGTSQLACRALAMAHYFRRELSAFRVAANRVLALNPRDTDNIGMIGVLIAESGDWEDGLSALRKAMELNPHHAGWLHTAFMWDHYRKGDYEQALEEAEKINMPGFLWTHTGLAAIHAQLGNKDAAQRHRATFVDIAPDFAREARSELTKWFAPELVEQILDGLRKAGLDVAGDSKPAGTAPAVAIIDEAAAPSEVPRVAVVPFKTRTGDAELESFAEGLTEEITSGLSQFRHLVVVSSSAAARFKGPTDLGEVGRQLDARFLLEGSIRKAGTSVRVSVQLLDAATGAHLWAEHFDRDLGNTDILAAQDELTDRIVATVADSSGVLTRSLGALAKAKPLDALTAHECVLRTFVYWQHVMPDEHAEVRTALEGALKREPNHAEAWACLSWVFLDEFRFDFNVLPNALDRALQAAQRAVKLDATSQLAYRALAEAHYFRRELGAFLPAADRVLSLNPRDTSNVGMIGSLLGYAGEWERGCAVVQNVMHLNPHHAGWLHFMIADNHYRKGEYEKALEATEKVNMPGHYVQHADLAIINAQLGRIEEARKHLKKFIELAPDAARNYRAEMSKWSYSGELTEHKMDGLRKAGLDVDGVVDTPTA
jgi:TolB-like protein/Flp pilus assembly protein TadD/predicted Ser/Thr protein kinase